ncbi:hypothetical protein ZPAH1_orf00051 [Aeromonas phage ZPAH1]|nr:hypothetical protein ZPAH1_orf00051 [Aeromonas phage ZPAH1]
MTYLLYILYALAGYIGISILFWVCVYSYEWYRYKKFDELDHKFPINAPGSWKFIGFLSLFWPFILLSYPLQFIQNTIGYYKKGKKEQNYFMLWCEYPCWDGENTTIVSIPTDGELDNNDLINTLKEHVHVYCGWYDRNIEKDTIHWEYEEIHMQNLKVKVHEKVQS